MMILNNYGIQDKASAKIIELLWSHPQVGDVCRMCESFRTMTVETPSKSITSWHNVSRYIELQCWKYMAFICKSHATTIFFAEPSPMGGTPRKAPHSEHSILQI